MLTHEVKRNQMWQISFKKKEEKERECGEITTK
jgi:hypothetical protein